MNAASLQQAMQTADALLERGRHAEAIAAFDRALALDAGNVAAWANRGLALEALGRDADAAASFERVLALRPDLPEGHFNLGNALVRLKRYDDAVRHYRHAVALLPDFARAHANLGSALFSLQRWPEAIECFERAVTLEPRAAPLHDAIGLTLVRLERYAESLSSFDNALAIDPNYARALSNKARALYVLGRLSQARALIERAIALDPRNSANYLDLSEMKRFAANDPALAAMQKLLADMRAPEAQCNLHFALAKAYGDIGNAPESFRHLLAANALKRRTIDYDERAVIGSFERIAQVFTPALMREKSGHGDPSRQPIFIIGMPRSGTTLIEQILASHPRVHGAGEREDFRAAVVSASGRSDYPELVPAMTPADLATLGAAYRASVMASAPAADRFTDKLPANFAYAGLIHLALPNVRIIHTRRNPIDTCLSCFSISFRTAQKFAYDLGELGRFHRAYETLMAHWRSVLPPGVMLDVQYEDVVDDIEGQTRRILAHCGLDFDAACLAFHKAERPVRTASAAQVRQPLYRSAVGRWRPYRDQLQPLFTALGIEPD
jgi:tetratricopeptide (TPR) repeat protein